MNARLALPTTFAACCAVALQLPVGANGEGVPPELPTRILHSLPITAGTHPHSGYQLPSLDNEFRFPNGSTWTVRGWYGSHGITEVDTLEQFQGDGLTLEDLRPYPVVLTVDYFLEQYGLLDSEPVLAEYARRGGGLVVMGQIGERAQYHLDEHLGFVWITGGWTKQHATITDAAHPVMEGILDLPRAGGVFIDYDNTIDASKPLPTGAAILARQTGSPGRIALLAFERGIGRVVAGPWDGLGRPFAPTATDPWHVTGWPITENQLQLNIIRWVAGWIDYDEDGRRDPEDNCPDEANAGQADFDEDGLGDVCDLDDDNDLVPDGADRCPLENPEGVDADGDGCVDRLTDLPATVQELALDTRTEAALLDSIDAAMDSIGRGNLRAATGQLRALQHKVEAQRDKAIPGADADMLIAYVENVLAGL